MTTPEPTAPSPDLRTRLSAPLPSFVLAAAVVPLLLTAVAVAIQLALLPSLPNEIIIHWNAAGQPDNWAPAWTLPVLTAAIMLVTVALIVVPAIAPLRDGDRGPSYRLLAAIAAGLAALIGVLMTATGWYQTDGREVQLSTLVSAAALAALVVGAAVWLAQPRHEAPADKSVGVEPLTVTPGERVVWLRTTTAATGVIAVTVAMFFLLLITTLYMWASDAGTDMVIGGAALTVLTTVAVAVTLAFRVRIDDAGLHVTSIAGWPRFTVPIDDVASVQLTEVSPTADFGGFGIRLRGKATGVIVRRGPAIAVIRRSGRGFVVTVDDAESGAALLSALAQRHQPPASPDDESDAGGSATGD